MGNEFLLPLAERRQPKAHGRRHTSGRAVHTSNVTEFSVFVCIRSPRSNSLDRALDKGTKIIACNPLDIFVFSIFHDGRTLLSVGVAFFLNNCTVSVIIEISKSRKISGGVEGEWK